MKFKTFWLYREYNLSSGGLRKTYTFNSPLIGFTFSNALTLGCLGLIPRKFLQNLYLLESKTTKSLMVEDPDFGMSNIYNCLTLIIPRSLPKNLRIY